MAQTSYLWDNPGVGDSPAGGYGNSTFCRVIWRMLLNGSANQGVLSGWLNGLEVTDGGGLNAAVDTGGALCYGVWYENDAAAVVALPNNSTVEVVVRASWATQTARLAQVAALVQNPGVTYDIPLATVTTLAGVITLITDTRDYCEFSTTLPDGVVEDDHIMADAVTTAKLLNQTRHLILGAGALQPDATNPATRDYAPIYQRYRPYWAMEHGDTDTVWLTFRVPQDIVSATMTLYVWNQILLSYGGGAGNIRWDWSSWDAQPSAALANQTGGAAVSQAGRNAFYVGAYRDSLGTFNATAGDIFTIELYRDGTAGADTNLNVSMLYAVELEYTADS